MRVTQLLVRTKWRRSCQMENVRTYYILLPAVDCYETDQEFDEMFKTSWKITGSCHVGTLKVEAHEFSFYMNT
jgi:hypothetical protein